MLKTFAERICKNNMAEIKYCYILKVFVPLYNQHLTSPALKTQPQPLNVFIMD